jgi:hypothetical protein
VHLVPDESEQAVRSLIPERRASGMTLQAIADKLNALGIQRREGSRWDHRFVSLLLRCQVA